MLQGERDQPGEHEAGAVGLRPPPPRRGNVRAGGGQARPSPRLPDALHLHASGTGPIKSQNAYVEVFQIRPDAKLFGKMQLCSRSRSAPVRRLDLGVPKWYP